MLNDMKNFRCVVRYTMTTLMQSCQNVAALFQTFFYRHFVMSIFPSRVVVYTFMQSLEVEWRNKCIQLSVISVLQIILLLLKDTLFLQV